jgi:peroxiredoxin
MFLIRQFILGLIFVCISYVGSCQSSQFILTGEITGLDKGTIQIWQPKDSTFYATTNKIPITNGKFTIKGFLKFPSKTALVIIGEPDIVIESDFFYIDSGYQNLTINVSKDQIKLTSTAKTFQDHIQHYKPYVDSLNQLIRNLNKIIDEDAAKRDEKFLDSLNRLEKVLKVKKGIFLLEYIIEKPRSYVGLSELSSSINAYNNNHIYEMAYSFLSEELKQSNEGQETLKKINLVKQLDEGLKFPPFEVLNINKQAMSLSQIKLKKFTLVDFWFHNCGPCIEQFADLKKVYAKFINKNFEIIGVAVDKERYELKWREAIKKYELPWPQYWDIDGANCSKFQIGKFPFNFLLNEKGEIIAKNIDLKTLNVFLDKNL